MLIRETFETVGERRSKIGNKLSRYTEPLRSSSNAKDSISVVCKFELKGADNNTHNK